MGCFVVARLVLTTASRSPSAIAELLVSWLKDTVMRTRWAQRPRRFVVLQEVGKIWRATRTFKNPRWQTAPFWKNVKCDISATVWIDFGEMWYGDTHYLQCDGRPKICLLFFHKIGCHGNFPWDIGKKGPDRSSAPKTLSFGERLHKLVQQILRELFSEKSLKKRYKIQKLWT